MRDNLSHKRVQFNIDADPDDQIILNDERIFKILRE